MRNDMNRFAITIASTSIMDKKNEHSLRPKLSFINNLIVAKDELHSFCRRTIEYLIRRKDH